MAGDPPKANADRVETRTRNTVTKPSSAKVGQNNNKRKRVADPEQRESTRPRMSSGDKKTENTKGCWLYVEN